MGRAIPISTSSFRSWCPRVAYKKGPYFAEEGDFSSAGAADIDYYTKMPKGIASLGFGSNGYQRAMAANSYDSGPGHLLYGFELFRNDGPWVNPEDYRKLNGVLRFSRGTNADGYTVSLMGYHGKWNATRPDSAARGGRRHDLTLRRDRPDRRRPDLALQPVSGPAQDAGERRRLPMDVLRDQVPAESVLQLHFLSGTTPSRSAINSSRRTTVPSSV